LSGRNVSVNNLNERLIGTSIRNKSKWREDKENEKKKYEVEVDKKTG
jgi:hypothetical protein